MYTQSTMYVYVSTQPPLRTTHPNKCLSLSCKSGMHSKEIASVLTEVLHCSQYVM